MNLSKSITSYILTLFFLDEGCYNAVTNNNEKITLTEILQTTISVSIQTKGAIIPE